MTWFYLIRHGSHDWLEKGIAGWQPGIRLNDRGREEVKKLAEVLTEASVDFLYSSPLERTMETAEIIAERLKILPVRVSEAIGEVHYGDWTGLTFEEIRSSKEWSAYNKYRSGARIPNGEFAINVQQRMVSELLSLRDAHPDKKIAVVGHGDPLRLAILHFLGMPIDFIWRIELSPASVSLLESEKDYGRVKFLNYVPA
ncbi:MAG TPA: histidine phosphatase family protein [Acidobacteriota bacterium]|jgi:probable phosphoglycerate mutase|nr:histidine phosphatase family protein [Acidobacteriota bacterium]